MRKKLKRNSERKGMTIHLTDYDEKKLQQLIQNMAREFDRDYSTSMHFTKSFHDLINQVLAGANPNSFEYRTELSPNMLYRLKQRCDEHDPPQRTTLMSVCVGYELDLITTLALLDSLGLGFNRHNKRDYAYTYLLTRCKGMSIPECNEVLDALGIPDKYWLGSRERRRC